MLSAKSQPFCLSLNVFSVHLTISSALVQLIAVHVLVQGPLLLKWFSFNTSMDK